MTNNDHCIFCEIVKGEVPCNKVWEDEDFLAFADIYPVGEGHTLVIPKKHFVNLLDLDEENSRNYLNAIKTVAKILLGEHHADGFNLSLNNGDSAGQIVKHTHFHILPRKEGDTKRGLILG